MSEDTDKDNAYLFLGILFNLKSDILILLVVDDKEPLLFIIEWELKTKELLLC